MMRRIFQRQVRDNFLSLRFQLGLITAVLFFALNGFVYSWRAEQVVEEDARIMADADAGYERVTTVAQLSDARLTIPARPRGTEFITEGGFNWFHDALLVTPWWTQGGGSVRLESLRTTNNWMRRFELLDWTVIVRYVLSFLCVVLAYNAVSGEVESGTLRLVLSNPVSRAAFLGGKLLAHLVTLLVAVVAGMAVSLLILSLHGAVELNGDTTRSCVLFFVGATAYAALFLLLGTGISVLTRSSATSLVFLITAWTLVVVVVPQTSYLIATRTVPSAGNLSWLLREHEMQVQQAIIREGLLPREPAQARVDDYALERRFAERVADVVTEGDRILHDAYRQDRRQYEVARTIHLISPGYAFQYAVEAVLGSGLARFDRFHADGWRYRDHLRAFLRERDAADPESPHITILENFTSAAELDPGEIPRFEQRELPLADGLVAGTGPVAVLILETGLALLFAVVAFQRADVSA
ncbi:ABC transporter permease subunit [Candidatus Latescibacterota bacterium]